MTRVEALQGISLKVCAGEVFGFLGPNGAGKSTTIKILMGLIRSTSGTASVSGLDVNRPESRRFIGYLPENPSFYDYLTAEEYLRFVGGCFGMPGSLLSRKTEEYLKLLDLWDARKRPIRGFSKGMVQRLGLAQTLLHDPDVYILDEPMSGLDPVGRALVKEIMLDLKRRGKCVFFSTHITADVEAVCDRLAVIVGGVIRKVQRVDEIMAQGVEAYRVHCTDDDQALRVEPAALRETLAKLEQGGRKVTLVEPIRAGLERFFLDVVKECAAEKPV